MSIEISPKSFFQQPSVADMRLIACPGAEEQNFYSMFIYLKVKTKLPKLMFL